MALYIGFSSFEFQKTKSFKLNDVQLVELDLLNHIFTRKGTRVMMPNFGTIIPDLVFEPIDEATLLTIEDELRTVFQYDPRVALLQFALDSKPDENLVTVHCLIKYLELNVTQQLDFNIEFEGNN